MEFIKKTLTVAGKEIVIETGKLAKQANGSCVVRSGDTMVLVNAVISSSPKEGIDFMPLTVDYRERSYASGKIPGGFFKREAKPRDSEILVSRLIDRSIRPMFSDFWRNDTQITVVVLSHDGDHDTDLISVLGASVALTISDIPFEKPIATVRVGRINGQFVINPTISQLTESDLDLVVSGTDNEIQIAFCKL